MKNQRKGYLFAVLSALLYGSAPLGTKLFLQGGGTPLLMVFFRSSLTILPFYILGKIAKQSYKISGKQLKQLLILSLFGTTLSTSFLNLSYLFIPTGMATTIHFSYPVLVLLGGVLFTGAKLTKRQGICAVLCTAGVLLFYTPGGEVSLAGIALAFCSGMAFAFYTLYLSKSALVEMHPFVLGFYVSLFCSFSGVAGVLLTGGFPKTLSGMAIAMAFLVAMGAALAASALFQMGVQHAGPQSTALLSVLEPLTSIVLGVLVFSEPLSLRTAAGALCILAGAVLLMREPSSQS